MSLFEEEQQPSIWRNTNMGAGIGASIGAPLGMAAGINAHKSAEGQQIFRNAFTHPEPRGVFAKPFTHDHLRANLPRSPYLATGALVGGIGGGLQGAGIGAITDMARNMNQTPFGRIEPFTPMTDFYK